MQVFAYEEKQRKKEIREENLQISSSVD